MLQEIAIMKMLVHTNLVNLLEIINHEDSKLVYLVLEHIEGGTIMGYDEDRGSYVYRLTGRVMGEATASRTFKDLISALSYLHANHIAHRDIKPDNLLVDFNGKLKLSDFGVSSHFENDRKKSAISLVALARSKSRGSVSKTEGTFSFYSPEMCTVKTVHGYSAYMADMWAATVCLWIFIFGRVPFFHPEVMTLFQMIRCLSPPSPTCLPACLSLLTLCCLREEDPVMPHVVSPELNHLIKLCLQKDVTLRCLSVPLSALLCSVHFPQTERCPREASLLADPRALEDLSEG
jgi:serine/threonine protein kinase